MRRLSWTENRYSIYDRARTGGVDVDDSVDFAAKDRFELSYKDENGEENGEVFVIHRAPLSTHERFVAFPTEHWIGNFRLGYRQFRFR